MPIFRVKSEKIYTSQKKFTRASLVGSWQIWGMHQKHRSLMAFLHKIYCVDQFIIFEWIPIWLRIVFFTVKTFKRGLLHFNKYLNDYQSQFIVVLEGASSSDSTYVGSLVKRVCTGWEPRRHNLSIYNTANGHVSQYMLCKHRLWK